MFHINDNFLKLPESYLFSEVARRIAAFKEANPEADVIRMGIGDVTLPFCPAAVEAMHRAVDDEANTPLSMAMVRSKGILSCVRLLPSMTIRQSVWKSRRTRFLSATVPRAIQEI